MMKGKLIEIGKIGKSHGLKGALKVKIQEEYLEDFKTVGIVFININGMNIPHFIENTQSNYSIIKFEDVDDKESANILYHKSISMQESDIQFYTKKERGQFGLYEGFTIHDENLGIIGIINKIEEYPQQEMAFIDYKNEERMIPLHQDFIIEINEKEQKITMNLPEGLLNL